MWGVVGGTWPTIYRDVHCCLLDDPRAVFGVLLQVALTVTLVAAVHAACPCRALLVLDCCCGGLQGAQGTRLSQPSHQQHALSFCLLPVDQLAASDCPHSASEL
jgi:hypothetical protein